MADDGKSGQDEMRSRVDADETLKVKTLSRIRANSFHDASRLGDDTSGAHIDYTRVRIDLALEDAAVDKDAKVACAFLDKALALRKRWQGKMIIIDPDEKAQREDESPVGSPRRIYMETKQVPLHGWSSSPRTRKQRLISEPSPIALPHPCSVPRRPSTIPLLKRSLPRARTRSAWSRVFTRCGAAARP